MCCGRDSYVVEGTNISTHCAEQICNHAKRYVDDDTTDVQGTQKYK